MPRYFFHITGERLDLDDEGIELPSLGAARRQAVQFASIIMQDHPDLVLGRLGLRIEVADHTGLPLHVVTIRTSDVPAEVSVQAKSPAIH